MPKLRDVDVAELWYQQHGITQPYNQQNKQLSEGPVAWAPRSYDSTALDYFLWGYVKSVVYAVEPETIDVLD